MNTQAGYAARHSVPVLSSEKCGWWLGELCCSAASELASEEMSTCKAAASSLPLRVWRPLCLQCVLASPWVRPARGRHGHGRKVSAGWSLVGTRTQRCQMEAVVRLWASAVTRVCLLSCRDECTDREVKCLVLYKAVGRNFSPHYVGSCTEAYGHPPVSVMQAELRHVTSCDSRACKQRHTTPVPVARVQLRAGSRLPT